MAGFKRARSRDRDTATELINTAYADGQLDAGERDARVHRALVARTLDDLRQLTADLQGERLPERPGPQRRKVGAIVAALVLGGIGVGVAVAVATDDDPPPSVVTQEYVVPVTPEAVAALVADYEREFGTTRTFGLNLNRQVSQVWVPTDDEHARYRTIRVVGEGEYDETEAPRGAGDRSELDLADLDQDALEGSLARARTGLGVEDPTWTTLGLAHWDHAEGPEVTITVGNDYEESGYLVTDLAGTVLTEEPYAVD